MLMERKHILSKGNADEDWKKLKIVNEIIKSDDDTNNEAINNDNNQIAHWKYTYMETSNKYLS